MDQIFFVNSEGKIAGAEKSLILLAKILNSDYRLNVICPMNSALQQKMKLMGINCYHLPSRSFSSYFSFLGMIACLLRSLQLLSITLSKKVDLIHANNFYSLIVSLLPATISRKKLIWHARDYHCYSLLTRICGWFCRRIIAVSQSVKDNLIKQGVNPAKIEVVYNGVELPLLTTPPLIEIPKMQDNAGSKKFIFAAIGQFVPWKKQTLFLKAISRIASQLNAEFFLIGDDLFRKNSPYKRELIREINMLGLLQRIKILPWQEKMDEVWRKINCLVHTADQEPFGRVIIEAMAHKIPVIAINSCGPGEIIQHNKTGMLVPPDDVEQLSQAMLTVARNPHLARRLAHNSYAYAITEFAAEKTAKNTAQIYEKVLGR
ncbi:MAG: hypothetical protein AMJ78_04200 [Omnitrophica WOR_2 bacterium SM23_29]|nr:MAG: hypothetical protein AMJ78_04200 [Omnitrophica WOR_2 bacterium SM23_29]